MTPFKETWIEDISLNRVFLFNYCFNCFSSIYRNKLRGESDYNYEFLCLGETNALRIRKNILIAAFDVRQVQRKFYSIMRLKDSEEHVHKPIPPQMEIRMEKLIEKRCSSIESSLAFRSFNLFLHDIKLAS